MLFCMKKEDGKSIVYSLALKGDLQVFKGLFKTPLKGILNIINMATMRTKQKSRYLGIKDYILENIVTIYGEQLL